jgi:pseudouridine-5'-phosphate glycosidase
VNELLEVREEAAVALGSGGPVVALETTLVAHGFPPGEGVAVGLESERRVREAGAVPATVGVLDGRVVVGLDEEELARLRSAARPGSASWAPAASAGSIAASRRRPTSRPISASWRGRRCSSSPRA